MIKTRKIKVKSIENEEIMAMIMRKTIIAKIIIPIIIIIRIKFGNPIKI